MKIKKVSNLWIPSKNYLIWERILIMWKEEYKRNLFSAKTIIIIMILILVGCMSFFYTYEEKAYFISLQQDIPEDVNPERLAKSIENQNGIKFDLYFLLQSDFFEIYIIIILLFCGIFLASSVHSFLDSGQINCVVSRTSYKKFINSILISQSLYIVTIISISLVAILTIRIYYRRNR